MTPLQDTSENHQKPESALNTRNTTRVNAYSITTLENQLLSPKQLSIY